MKTSGWLERRNSLSNDLRNEKESTRGSRLVSQRSKTLKQALQQYTPVQVSITFRFMSNWNVYVITCVTCQVWDWLFKACEVNGRILFRDGFIDVTDIEECIVKGKCKKLGIKLPAWSILQCLLASAKSESPGLVICEFYFLDLNERTTHL